MNKFIGALASFCGEHRLEQKILIGPSLRVGHQWIENVTRDGFSVTNVRVQTLKGFALSIANLRLASTGQKWISETGAWIIVTRLINELIGTGESYFSALFPRDTLARSLSQTIYSLRISGIRPEDLDPGAFESSEKAHDIAWLLNEYLRILDERKLVDYAEVLTLGTQLIQDGGIQQSGIFFALAPEDLDIASLEKKLIESIGPDRFIFLPVDKPASGAEGDKVSDARILSWIMEPASAPEAQGDGSGKIFQALGFTNEVREAIRQTIAPTEISSTQPRHHLDEVELLYTDQRTYVPIIYDLFSYAALSQDIDTPFELVTFADGIPARLSRPGHALIAWLSWIRNGYPQSSLVNMIQEGWLQSDALSDENTIIRLMSLLRSIRIGRGSQNYRSAIQRKIEELEQAKDNQETNSSKRNEVKNHVGPPTKKHGINDYRALLELTNGLLLISQPSDMMTTLDSALFFLENFARSGTEFDNYSKLALKLKIQELRGWLENESDSTKLDIFDWLMTLPDETRVMGSGPQPGKLHTANLASGGHSGRIFTFILGLDDTRFPGATFQDPTFLDHEKERISPDLTLAATEPKQKVLKLARLFARLRGSVTLGFTSHDILEDRALFPSSALFSAFRILSNQRESDQERMFEWLGAPASVAASSSDIAIESNEWWLSFLCDRDYQNARDIVAQNFPNLARGSIALEKRCSDTFTEYDGFIGEFCKDMDPTTPGGPVLSASALETLGSCPLRYFFRYALGLKPPDEVELDPTRWLDPMQFGNLAHEVFYTFGAELIKERRKPLYERDLPKLLKILDVCIKRHQFLVPAQNDSAVRRQILELESAAKVFLVEEEIISHKWRPTMLEASIGLAANPEATVTLPDPMSLRLSDGSTVRTRGKIDRVDKYDSETESIFRIVDYKLGSSYKYEQGRNFSRGSIVQHILYSQLAENLLRHSNIHTPIIHDFVYFFPGIKTRGLRIHRSPKNETEFDVIGNLCKIISNAAFIATNDSKDCKYCDYLIICDDPKTQTEFSLAKLKNSRNKLLDPVRELRGI